MDGDRKSELKQNKTKGEKRKEKINEQIAQMESTVDKQPFIVMDLGSKYIKVGFSGEDRPRITIPN